MDGARRSDVELCRVPHAEAAALIRRLHYAKGCSNTSVLCLGLRRAGELVGAALWLPPTKNAALSVSPYFTRVIALSRVAVAPGEPKNSAGMLVGYALREIQRDVRWLWAVTWADMAEGHTGHLYKVTNWTELGKTKAEPYWTDQNGARVAKLSTKSRTSAEMLALGYTKRMSPGKFKFVYKLRS